MSAILDKFAEVNDLVTQLNIVKTDYETLELIKNQLQQLDQTADIIALIAQINAMIQDKISAAHGITVSLVAAAQDLEALLV